MERLGSTYRELRNPCWARANKIGRSPDNPTRLTVLFTQKFARESVQVYTRTCGIYRVESLGDKPCNCSGKHIAAACGRQRRVRERRNEYPTIRRGYHGSGALQHDHLLPLCGRLLRHVDPVGLDLVHRRVNQPPSPLDVV